MSLYTDTVANVITWTNKPRMLAETDAAIRLAVRTAHRANKFPKDLAKVSVTGLSTAAATQTIDLVAACPLFRQMARVSATGFDSAYDEVLIGDLLDLDGYARTDVYYAVGTALNIRAATPATGVDLWYYKYPTTSPIASLDSWIATEYPDLISCWAAATVLAMIGEQEIRSRVDALAKLSYDQLIQDQLQLTGR